MSFLIVGALWIAGLTYSASAVGDAHPQSHAPVQLAEDIAHYYVYCIGDETSVEQWDLEQMKVRRGNDVCLLYTDTSVSGAQEWMDKNFPSHECYCNN